MDMYEILMTVFAVSVVCPAKINCTPEQPSNVVTIPIIIVIIIFIFFFIAVPGHSAYTLFCFVTCCLHPVMGDLPLSKFSHNAKASLYGNSTCLKKKKKKGVATKIQILHQVNKKTNRP